MVILASAGWRHLGSHGRKPVGIKILKISALAEWRYKKRDIDLCRHPAEAGFP